jgi:hypothetical protein
MKKAVLKSLLKGSLGLAALAMALAVTACDSDGGGSGSFTPLTPPALGSLPTTLPDGVAWAANETDAQAILNAYKNSNVRYTISEVVEDVIEANDNGSDTGNDYQGQEKSQWNVTNNTTKPGYTITVKGAETESWKGDAGSIIYNNEVTVILTENKLFSSGVTLISGSSIKEKEVYSDNYTEFGDYKFKGTYSDQRVYAYGLTLVYNNTAVKVIVDVSYSESGAYNTETGQHPDPTVTGSIKAYGADDELFVTITGADLEDFDF